MSKKEGTHSVGKTSHPESSRRKENTPKSVNPASVVKGLGGIVPNDDPSDRNASTRAGVRSNEPIEKKQGAHDLGKSNHPSATTRAENLPKHSDPNKVVRGLSTKDLPKKNDKE